MQSDWIKMRTDLYRDPKVILMADALLSADSDISRYVNQNLQRDMSVTRNVMRNAVVGALVSVWGVIRRQGSRDGDDLLMIGHSETVVDDIAELHGLGSAMADCGWLVIGDDGLRFPRFFAENNSDPKEDHNVKNAERQRRFREAKRDKSNVERNVTRNVTCSAKSNAREEKRREENNRNTGDAVASGVPEVVLVNGSDAAAVNAPRRRKPPFVKPTVCEIADYVGEINATVDAQQFWDYYESNGWRVGRNPMKDWKATVRQWQARKSNGSLHSNERSSNSAAAREGRNASAFEQLQRARERAGVSVPASGDSVGPVRTNLTHAALFDEADR